MPTIHSKEATLATISDLSAHENTKRDMGLLIERHEDRVAPKKRIQGTIVELHKILKGHTPVRLRLSEQVLHDIDASDAKTLVSLIKANPQKIRLDSREKILSLLEKKQYSSHTTINHPSHSVGNISMLRDALKKARGENKILKVRIPESMLKRMTPSDAVRVQIILEGHQSVIHMNDFQQTIEMLENIKKGFAYNAKRIPETNSSLIEQHDSSPEKPGDQSFTLPLPEEEPKPKKSFLSKLWPPSWWSKRKVA